MTYKSSVVSWNKSHQVALRDSNPFTEVKIANKIRVKKKTYRAVRLDLWCEVHKFQFGALDALCFEHLLRWLDSLYA